jgi:flagellar hook-length control protein FliK
METTVSAAAILPGAPATTKASEEKPAKGGTSSKTAGKADDAKENQDFAAMLSGSSLSACAAVSPIVPLETILPGGDKKGGSSESGTQAVKAQAMAAEISVAVSPARPGTAAPTVPAQPGTVAHRDSSEKAVVAVPPSVQAAEDPAGAVKAAAAPQQESDGQAARRAVGQGLLDEKFPEGWEVLLEDKPAASTGVRPALAGKKSSHAGSSATAADGSAHTSVKQRDFFISAAATGSEKAAEPTAAAVKKESIIQDLSPGSAGGQGKGETGTGTHKGYYATESVTASSGAGYRASVEGSVHPAMEATLASAKTLAGMNDVQKHMVVQDFVQTTLHHVNGDSQTLSVDLHPPELGHVKVMLESQGDHVNACLMVQDKEVGEMFKQHAGSIRQSLEDAGIKLGGLSVEIRQQFHPGAGEEYQDQTGFKTGAQPSGPAIPESMPIRKWAALATGKVDMMV